MHKNAQKCVWEKTPPLSGKNPTPPMSSVAAAPAARRVRKNSRSAVTVSDAPTRHTNREPSLERRGMRCYEV